MNAEERLARIVADPNLRHTGARWRAHEAAYPGRGAAAMIDGYAERDAVLAAEVEASLASVRAHTLDDDDELIAYLMWLFDELRPECAIPHTGVPPSG